MRSKTLLSAAASMPLLSTSPAGAEVIPTRAMSRAITQVALPDVYASRFDSEIDERTATAVIPGVIFTQELLQNRPDIGDKMDRLGNPPVLRGGVPVEAAGPLLGALSG